MHQISESISSGARLQPSVDTIYQRMLTAIIEHRLPPGTKLGEERIAAYAVSSVLHRPVESKVLSGPKADSQNPSIGG